MPTYDEMTVLLSNREPFRGNSVSAYYDGTEYQVWSYNTKIASIELDVMNTRYYGFTPHTWWIDTRVYSKTTSRIQNIVREIDRVERSEINAS